MYAFVPIFISLQVQSAVAVGTPDYISPEILQVRPLVTPWVMSSNR
jgi:hypothetical protein